jgi:hypothetical protein
MAVTPPPEITPAPTPAPQRGDRTTFRDRVDDFITWLTAAVAMFNAVVLNVYQNATSASESAGLAQGSASTASQKANDAAGSAGTAAQKAGEASASAGQASGYASAASASATAAANSATALTATSTSSNTVGAGTKTFAIPPGKQFAPGVNVKAVHASNAANAMYGTVASHIDNGTTATLVLTVTTFEGSGTITNWNLAVVGQRGPQGPVGNGRVFTETVVTAGGSWVTDAEDFDVILQAPGSGGKQLFGGSSGGYVKKTFRGVPIGTVCTYVQGAAGVGTTADNNNGTDGGDSTFTVPGFGTLTAGGGKLQGWINPSTVSARAGGTASGGDVNIPGQIGDDYSLHTYVGNPTVNFPRKGGNGADSMLGKGGVAVVPVGGLVNAYPAVGYGAGGGGASEAATATTTTYNASNGGPGVLRIIR